IEILSILQMIRILHTVLTRAIIDKSILLSAMIFYSNLSGKYVFILPLILKLNGNALFSCLSQQIITTIVDREMTEQLD
ncbi:hypothetical protein, partial [Enterococcus sp. 3H8_DIV0648]|uniref:hypothetical protein n=1 Tax=Enterococcus sp. 3H8_DIV0648 TaxID=1834178 RepID=UPI000B73AE6E